jgi:hypothetical protein
VAVVQRLKVQGLEPHGFGVRPAGAGELAKRRTSPQLGRVVNCREAMDWIGLGTGGCHCPFEPVGVDVGTVDLEYIAPRPGLQSRPAA